ncbi:hypothetical protein MLD38_022767 [Melastoma candidum]|uniref:Uncharacterized protein n=1 Tax=Melastoma candidum TaxID=119954 RepID=A0ACB9QJI4_9MYRT|nr:hypothetical protein MLD38_022767 [Melastoma candidum]
MDILFFCGRQIFPSIVLIFIPRYHKTAAITAGTRTTRRRCIETRDDRPGRSVPSSLDERSSGFRLGPVVPW